MHLDAKGSCWDSSSQAVGTHRGRCARTCFGGPFCSASEKRPCLQLILPYFAAPQVKLSNSEPPLLARHPDHTLPACVHSVHFIEASVDLEESVEAPSAQTTPLHAVGILEPLNVIEASHHPQQCFEAPSVQTTPLHALGILEPLNATTPIPVLASILKKICQNRSLSAGKFLHYHIRWRRLHLDRFLGNCLIEMYGECGSTTDARAVFDSLPNLNSYSWNIMINAYSRNGQGEEALEVFYLMLQKGFQPNYCTFICTLNACTCAARVRDVEDVHALIVACGCRGESSVETALIAVYGKCGCFVRAVIMFCGMLDPTVVSWNALLSACTQTGHNQVALNVFGEMQKRGQEPDSVTLTSTLDACAEIMALIQGQQIHALIMKHGFHEDLTLMTALINMYGVCGIFNWALNLFTQIRRRDVVCWNAFISACVNNRQWDMATKLLYEMQVEGLKPNALTYGYVLDACANLALLGEGEMIHDQIIKDGYEGELFLGTSLMNMYGKCGAVRDAKGVFREMPSQDLISWSAIITACAQSGRSEEALGGFHSMKRAGIVPDETVYLSILTACSHAGWVYDGMLYFLLMLREHGLRPAVEHYTCMVDLLGRAGHLADAEGLISTMPYEKNATVWSCLLGACKIHGDHEQGVRAANQAIAMGSTMATSFLMLSDILYTEEESVYEELSVSRGT